MIDPEKFQQVIQLQINAAISNEVNKLLTNSEWADYIKSQAIAQFVRVLKKELNSLDLDTKVQSYVTEVINSLDAKGIDNQATAIELTIMDGVVVVENDFAASNIQAVENFTTNNAFVSGDLIVKGNINTDGTAWNNLKTSIEETVTKKFNDNAKKDIVNDILTRAESHGINFSNVTINGTNLVSGDTLSSKITKTNIQQLGSLNEISVVGEADFNNTAFVANKRLGINTREPSSALSVWDEEVEIAVGKRKERTGFIGTNRKQHLEIGVNGKGNITINDDGLVVIDRLQIGKQRISHGSEVPGYSGTKGDIVFNINIVPKNPIFAWMCVGGYNWVALSASIS